MKDSKQMANMAPQRTASRRALAAKKSCRLVVLSAVLLLLPLSPSYAQCFWTMDATFWGDAKGNATVYIHCKDGTGIISASSNRGSFDNIPIDASGDDRSVTMSGDGSYGYITYSGVAKGAAKNGSYSGTWKVTLVGSDGRRRNFSGKWQGTGNYNDVCGIDSCK